MKALVTSGGGAKGAFSVGALLKIHEYGLDDFDIISGTSTGSLIAAMAAIKRIDLLEKEYKNVSNNDILVEQNIIENLIRKRPYFYDTVPLQDKIEYYVTREVFQQMKESDKYVCFTAVNLHNGKTTVFTTKKFSSVSDYDVIEIDNHKTLVSAMLASSSQAAFLKPVTINGKQYVDGGNRHVLPAMVAADLHADEIFALSNSPLNLTNGKENYTNVIDVLLRSVSVFIQEIRENDYKTLRTAPASRKLEFQPDFELDYENPTGLSFDKLKMRTWMDLGKVKAEEVLKAGGYRIVSNT